MRKLVDDIASRLDLLMLKMKDRGVSEGVLSGLSELREELRSLRTPIGLSRRLWDKYIVIVATLEETMRIIEKPEYTYILPSLVSTIRDYTREFKTLVEKAYTAERLQIALPLLLGVAYVFIKTYQEGLLSNIPLLVAATIAITLSIPGHVYTLVAMSGLGVVLLLYGGEFGSMFSGVMLLAISLLYGYVVYYTRTAKFNEKINQALDNISKLISSSLEPPTLRIEDVYGEIVKSNKYSVDSTGVFKYIDSSELLRFKAALLLIHKYPLLSSPRANSNINP